MGVDTSLQIANHFPLLILWLYSMIPGLSSTTQTDFRFHFHLKSCRAWQLDVPLCLDFGNATENQYGRYFPSWT